MPSPWPSPRGRGDKTKMRLTGAMMLSYSLALWERAGVRAWAFAHTLKRYSSIFALSVSFQ